MSIRKYIVGGALCFAMALSLPVAAQNATPITWSQDLEFLQKLTPSELVVQQGAVASIRHEVENWIALHPNQQIKLSSVPAQPWTSEQTQTQINELIKAVTVLASNEAHPFHLGQTEVVVNGAVSPLSPMAVSVGQDQLQKTNTMRVSDAIDQLPGIEVSRGAGFRNETTYYLRGFSNTEVPLYVDGIPQYVPYDGRIDLARFLSSDLAEVQVTRGYSSPLLGPGALAGSINLVTREPQRPYEADLAIGTGSGNQLNSSAVLGRRATKYFVQGNVDWAQRDYVPLPGGYKWGAWPTANYPSTYTMYTNEYPNTASLDQKYGGRIGWTPKASDSYVFTYTTQKGNKEPLPYIGLNTTTTASKYDWPYWSKGSYYFMSNTKLDEKDSIQSRIYYDQYWNRMDGYTDYTFQTASYQSWYKDHTDGGNIEFHTARIPRNQIGAAIIFKDDTHHEHSYGSMNSNAAAYLTVYPWRTLRAQETSYGIEDVVTVTSRLHVTGGFSIDHMSGKTVQMFTTAYTTVNGIKYYGVQPNKCSTSPTNTSYAGCTPHYTEYNPQIAATYALTSADTVYTTFSRRGAYPTMSQMFTSNSTTTIPNPNLQEEHGTNWNFGYTHTFNRRLTTDLQLFRSSLTNAIVSGYGYTSIATLCPAASTSVINGTTYYKCTMSWNAGKTTNEGIEAQIHTRPIDRLSIDANYAYLNRYIHDSDSTPSNIPAGIDTSVGAGATGTQSYLSGIPRHKIAAIATITAPRGIVGIIRQRYEGGTRVSDSGTAVTALHPTGIWSTAMAVTDASVTVPLYKGAKLQTGVNNLFDRYYFYTAGYPQAGRNWFFNMRYTY